MTKYLSTRHSSKKVICQQCDYSWLYKGELKHRIRCPKCHSSRNEANRRIFGVWNPNTISKSRRCRM